MLRCRVGCGETAMLQKLATESDVEDAAQQSTIESAFARESYAGNQRRHKAIHRSAQQAAMR
jgi:hypothetical protein